MTPPAPNRVLLLCALTALATPAVEILAQQAPPGPPAANPADPPGSAKPAPPASAAETPAVIVDNNQAQTLLGRPVRSAKGEDLGRVVDVIVDRSGVVQAAIIDFGGFLGVGTRKIAVDWHILHFPDSGPPDKLIADLPRDQLRKAPIYKEGEPIVIMGRTAPVPAPPAASAPGPGTPAPAAAAPPSPAPAPPPDTPAQPPQTEQPKPKP